MKKILTLNLILIFLLSLAFNKSAFGYSSGSLQKPFSDFKPQITAVSFTAKVNVITALPQNQIVLSDSSSVGSCKAGGFNPVEPDVVQSTAVVNLNQPAGCFKIDIGVPEKNYQKLLVKTLSVSQKIVFYPRSQQIQNPDLLPAPFEPATLPVLPAFYFVLVIAMVLGRERINSGRYLSKLKTILVGNNNRLQILRC